MGNAPRFYSAVLSIVAVVTLASCDVGAASNETDFCPGSFEMRVNGRRVSADACTAGELLGSLNIHGSTGDIDGPDYRSYGLTISPAPAQGTTGTFAITGDEAGRCLTRAGVCGNYKEEGGLGADPYFEAPAGAGQVRITTFTRQRLAGTFAFEAFNGRGERRAITAGQFDLDLE